MASKFLSYQNGSGGHNNNRPTAENTPLFRTSSRHIGAFMNEIFSADNMNKVGLVARGRLQELQQSVQSGNWSIRLLALLAGCGLIATAGVGVLIEGLTWQFTRALMELYTFVMGCLILVLESRQLSVQSVTSEFVQAVFKYALFLRFVWGRGMLYFVAGSLQLGQGSLIDICVGAYVMVIGILYYMVGRKASIKLNDLRQSLVSETTLRDRFAEADVERKGALTLSQFRTLTDSLALDLTKHELEAAFLFLDKSGDDQLSFEEFKTWWEECDVTADNYV